MNLPLLLAIFVAGGLGATTRFLVTRVFANSSSNFPWAILLCNVVGCALIGAAAGALGEQQKPSLFHLALMTGFLGGLTTFSSFSLDSLKLISSGQIGLALCNIGLSVAIGLFFTWLGFKLGQSLPSPSLSQ